MGFLKDVAIKVAARVHVDSLNPRPSPVKRALAVVLAERGIKSTLENESAGKEEKNKQIKSQK